MENTQILLTIILSLSTIILVIIGIQLIFILNDLRKILIKINLIIEGFEKIGLSFEHGLEEIIGFISGFKVVLKFFDIFNKKNGKKS
jgi:hypothetical protein